MLNDFLIIVEKFLANTFAKSTPSICKQIEHIILVIIFCMRLQNAFSSAFNLINKFYYFLQSCFFILIMSLASSFNTSNQKLYSAIYIFF